MPALTGSFVDWDDRDLLLLNTRYRTLDAESLRWMFTTSYTGHFQPLTWLSYALDWAIWKRESFGYHLTNLVLHAGAAVAFYFVARELIAITRWGTDALPSDLRSASQSSSVVLAASFAAVLFATHPLRAESVAWIAERRDVLSGFLSLLAVACYLRYAKVRTRSRRAAIVAYLATFGFLAFSLLAKATATTLPVVLLILDVYPLRRLGGSRGLWRGAARGVWLEKLPLAALGLAAGVRAIVAQAQQDALYPLGEYDLPARLAQACYGVTFYLWKTLWPSALGPLYQLPPRSVLFGAMLWRSLPIVAGLTIIVVVLRRRIPALTAAFAAYVVLLAPVLGFAQSGPQLVADRYSYLPCLGFAVLAGVGIAWVIERFGRNRSARAVVVLSVAGTLTALQHATYRQCDIWRSSLTLWAQGVRVSPDSSVAHVNYADALSGIGDLDGAVRHYQRGLELEPRDPIATNHLADLLSRLGDAAGATAMYERTLQLDGKRAAVYPKLAHLLIVQDRAADAVALLRGRLSRAPSDLETMSYLAELLATYPDGELRNGAEAARWAGLVSDAYGGTDGPALLTYATALAEAGRFDESVSVAERALRFADGAGNERLADELRRRLTLFRSHQAYHFGD
jgi:tetratricopeptide (TPR) repeat protein